MTIMPLTYSITNGIGFGFIAYTLIRIVQGKAREISWMLWIATVGFLIYFLVPLFQSQGLGLIAAPQGAFRTVQVRGDGPPNGRPAPSSVTDCGSLAASDSASLVRAVALLRQRRTTETAAGPARARPPSSSRQVGLRYEAMTSSTVDPDGTTVPASGRMFTTVPEGWPVLGFVR